MAVKEIKKVKATGNSLCRKLFAVLADKFEIDMITGDTNDDENIAGLAAIEGAKLFAQLIDFEAVQAKEIEDLHKKIDEVNKKEERILDALELIRKNQAEIMRETKNSKDDRK